MLGVGRRELRRCLCICVKEFNMERAASKLCASLWAIIMSMARVNKICLWN